MTSYSWQQGRDYVGREDNKGGRDPRDKRLYRWYENRYGDNQERYTMDQRASKITVIFLSLTYHIMIKLLLRFRRNFFELTWIKTLIEAGVVSSALGRTISGAIRWVYISICTYVITGLTTHVRENYIVALYAISGTFALAIIEGILKAIRNRQLDTSTPIQ